jgi:prepilin-type N-terminal cleavage/methylation domain-containing protein
MAYLFKRGFTLTELLIGISLLGLFSALTLPSVFNSISEQKDRAILRKTTNDIMKIAQTGYARGEVPLGNASALVRYIVSKVNAAKICPTQMLAEGCMNYDYNWADNVPGYVTQEGWTVSLATWGDDAGLTANGTTELRTLYFSISKRPDRMDFRIGNNCMFNYLALATNTGLAGTQAGSIYFNNGGVRHGNGLNNCFKK